MTEFTPIIPEGKIAWIVNGYHVATPFDEIRADLERRMTDRYWNDEKREAVYAFALEVHNDNRRVYNSVVSGRVSNELLG